VARRAAFLKNALKETGHRLLLAGGDNFGPGGFEDRIKGVTMLKALKAMNYDAIGLGDFDFAYGPQVLLDAIQGLPVVATNLVWSDTRKPVAETMIVKKFRGIPSEGRPGEEFKVAVLALMDERMQGPVDFYFENQQRRLVIRPALEVAREWVPRARAKADVVVLLMHMNSTEAMKLAGQVPGIDIVVCGHSSEQLIDPPRKAGSTWTVANGDRGRYVGELRFNLDAKHHLSDPAARQTVLDDKAGLDSLGTQLVAQSKAEIEAEKGAMKPVAVSVGGSPGAKGLQWVTSQVCVNCHQGVVDSWSRTPHAKAYQALVKAGKEKNEDCLRCHVVGLKSGGFNPADPQPILAGVQCESCHGPGYQHAIAGDSDRKGTIVRKPDAEVCRTCHTREQSPKFDFHTYWEKIKHS
jgi:hypothetical protein